MSARRYALLLVLVVALVPSVAPGAGPDAFGYHSVRSADPGGPSFLPFVDISATGTRLVFVDPDDGTTPNADDGIALDLPLGVLNGGRGFPFYGTFHTTIGMSTNGFLDFAPSVASDVQNNHCPLPDPTLRALRELGYRPEPHDSEFGDVQAIWIDAEGRVAAASDPRGRGVSRVLPPR